MMKKIFLYSFLICLTSSLFAESKKPDFSKMSEKELMAYFMETHKRKKAVIAKSKALDQELKKSEEELAKAKKLGKTLDDLNNMLGIKD
jgi:hypothetical protein